MVERKGSKPWLAPGRGASFAQTLALSFAREFDPSRKAEEAGPAAQRWVGLLDGATGK